MAIATRRLEAGTRIADGQITFALSHTVLEGHRFAVRPIRAGEAVLSWRLPFGTALRDIAPGDYVCNRDILEALRVRNLNFALPDEPNFKDWMKRYHLDEDAFRPGDQVPLYETPPTFMGYRRSPSRGVGTRNVIVLLGTTSQSASYVKRLEERLRGRAAAYPDIDGIVAVAHTEGGEDAAPNNRELLLRTLAGFMTHPNVGAVLAVDYGTEAVTNRLLRAYMQTHDYPLDDVPHRFYTLSRGFHAELEYGEAVVDEWVDAVDRTPREAVSAAHLKLALQCGGSDAFSGISGNPLAAWVAREIIRAGGCANLAETDELIGAESYVLQNVRDLETAETFLAMIERFKERAAWHGQTVDANPSGGNKFRGIYNIALKSIGAARKKHPDVRLDYAIEYGERMREPGYYFMDSPGNDLESVAGQVASGANLIFFITGNGSITNFPFVPTIKIVTTTKRYELLSKDMDVNAGAYLDGTPMDALGREMLRQTLDVASGARTRGERAGHAQVSIWRNWRQTDHRHTARLLKRPMPDGAPIETSAHPVVPALSSMRIRAARIDGRYVTDRLGLILPTSLCSGQIARMAASRLNRAGIGRDHGISRFVALAHTEGCGVSGGPSEALYTRTMTGYLTHPLTACGLLLEHGCERTHNDYYRQHLRQQGVDPDRFGWASVQLDGGIERVLARIEDWFTARLAGMKAPVYDDYGLDALRLGLMTTGVVPGTVSRSLARVTQAVVRNGGTLVIPDHTALLTAPAYRDALFERDGIAPSLAYGQPVSRAGFHIMETQTGHWVETLTGLGATGVDLIIAYTGTRPMQGHPMIPVAQISADGASGSYADDLDLVLNGDTETWPARILALISAVASRRSAPKSVAQGNIDFQVTRGLLGVSM